MNCEFLEFNNQPALVAELTERIGNLLSVAIRDRGEASLAVSSGSTPVPMFEALSQVDLEWGKVVVSLVDERWVEVSEKDSNENLVRFHLLKNKAASARFIGMKTTSLTAIEGEEECAGRLQDIPMPYDVLILGMGNDGHTASLFPGVENLAKAVDMTSGNICMGITPLTAPHERMTLTLPALLNSREIILHICGEEKSKVYEKAIAEGSLEEMPIRFVLRQEKVPVKVYWAP
jgi:6-phosphogluconolactonase